MAFVAETVVGATPAPCRRSPTISSACATICDRYGVLLILDEVMCGMGRTGTLHACEQEGVAPDLMTIAKGLGGGYQPIGAVLLSAGIFDAFADGSGSFQHGHTYMGHPMAARRRWRCRRSSRATICSPTSGAMGERLRRAPGRALRPTPAVGDIRGRGLFRGSNWSPTARARRRSIRR